MATSAFHARAWPDLMGSRAIGLGVKPDGDGQVDSNMSAVQACSELFRLAARVLLQLHPFSNGARRLVDPNQVRLRM